MGGPYSGARGCWLHRLLTAYLSRIQALPRRRASQRGFLQLRGDAVKHSENLCRGADLKLCPTAVWRVRSRVSTAAQTEKTTTGTFFWAPLASKQRQRTNVTRGIFISYKDLSRRRFSLLTILQHVEMGGGHVLNGQQNKQDPVFI